MKIVVHPPTIEAPDGTEDVAAVILSAIRRAVRDLGGDDLSPATDSVGEESASAEHGEEPASG